MVSTVQDVSYRRVDRPNRLWISFVSFVGSLLELGNGGSFESLVRQVCGLKIGVGIGVGREEDVDEC